MGRVKELIQDIAGETIRADAPAGIYDGVYLGNNRVRLEQQLEVTVLIPEHLTDWKLPIEINPFQGSFAGSAVGIIPEGSVTAPAYPGENPDINIGIAQTNDYPRDPIDLSISGGGNIGIDGVGRIEGTIYFKNHLNVGDNVLVARYQEEKKYVVLARLRKDVT